jgi:hypothetical protein
VRHAQVGRIEKKEHPLYGLDFMHAELSPSSVWSPPIMDLIATHAAKQKGVRVNA